MTTAELLHHYEPRGAAKELFDHRGSEVLLSGPAGTGKSRACLEKLHLMALVNPGMRGLIVRKTRESLGSTALVTWREHVAKEALAAGLVSFYGGSAEEPAQYRFRNGSKVMIGGMDKPTKIMSSEYDVAYVQEATELSTTDWENITTRLRNGRISFQQLMADCNPDIPTHWLRQRCDSGATKMLHCRHEDNPRLFNADGSITPEGRAYLAKLDALTGVRKQRLRYGLWVAAEGLIYEDWDESVHLVEPFDIPSSWTRWWAVDFGFTNPMVIQWWAEDPDGRLYLYRETYRTKCLVEDHAKHALRLVQRCVDCCESEDIGHDCHDCEACRLEWTEPRPRAVICDHDAEDRATLEKHLGMSTSAAKKSVSDGIQAVQSRFKAAGDGKPRIFLVRDARVDKDAALDEAKRPTCTAEEIVGYVWDRGTAKAQQDDKPPKEVPVKENDHGCLVAGTVVETARGPVVIEQVRQGDMVLTRVGRREVLASGMTSESALVYRVELSTGAVLTGTGNHPVWVEGEGWKRMDTLRYMDRLFPCQTANPYASAASSSAATPTPRTGLTASTTRPGSQTGSAALGACTKRSGSRRTDPSPTDARSTTPTTIRTTTTWITSSASLSPSTRKPTASAAASEAERPSSRRISTGSDCSRPRGIVPRRGAPGIASTPRNSSSATASSAPRSASSAVPHTRRPGQPLGTGSAPTSARPLGGERAASTTSRGCAPTAAVSSPSTATTPSGAAGVHVLSVSALPKRAPVFNLTVDDQPEYFAQGVLVHNCDALRYMVAERDLGGRPRVRWL